MKRHDLNQLAHQHLSRLPWNWLRETGAQARRTVMPPPRFGWLPWLIGGLLGAAAGAAIMALLDPDRGKKRRAELIKRGGRIAEEGGAKIEQVGDLASERAAALLPGNNGTRPRRPAPPATSRRSAPRKRAAEGADAARGTASGVTRTRRRPTRRTPSVSARTTTRRRPSRRAGTEGSR